MCVPLLELELTSERDTPSWSEPRHTVWDWQGARPVYTMKSRKEQLESEGLPYFCLEGLEQTLDTVVPDLYGHCG